MDIQIVRLSEDHDIKPFDCEDTDLNDDTRQMYFDLLNFV